MKTGEKVDRWSIYFHAVFLQVSTQDRQAKIEFATFQWTAEKICLALFNQVFRTVSILKPKLALLAAKSQRVHRSFLKRAQLHRFTRLLAPWTKLPLSDAVSAENSLTIVTFSPVLSYMVANGTSNRVNNRLWDVLGLILRDSTRLVSLMVMVNRVGHYQFNVAGFTRFVATG